MSETIAALASGKLPAGVAVIRVSGPNAFSIVNKLTEISCQDQLHGQARLLTLFSPDDHRVLDTALRIVFKGPRSFTGEDVVELHVHGGLVIIDEVLEQLYTCGARPANRGEFSERAFINGKIDLTQAEAIADIISAPTRSARELATHQLGGVLTDRITAIEKIIQSARVLVEASIDFPEDVGDVDRDVFQNFVSNAAESLINLQQTARRGKLVRQGASVVLIGAPNVGKSSLLNALAGRERAIVSPVAGTTRDTIDIHVELGGIPVVLTDTAGIRESTDVIERIGIERTISSVKDADIVLALQSADTPCVPLPQVSNTQPVITVNTKSDLADTVSTRDDEFYVSVITGHGLDALIDGILAKLLDSDQSATGQDVIAINARHSALIKFAIEALHRANNAVSLDVPADLLAVELNDAAFHLASISGRDVIGTMHQEIFSRFCIGK